MNGSRSLERLESGFVGRNDGVIDESKPKDETDYLTWKADFQKKKADFVDDAKKRVKQKKENEILGIAAKIKSDPSTVKSQLDSITVAQLEIDAETSEMLSEEDDRAKYRYVKHPLKKVKVAF